MNARRMGQLRPTLLMLLCTISTCADWSPQTVFAQAVKQSDINQSASTAATKSAQAIPHAAPNGSEPSPPATAEFLTSIPPKEPLEALGTFEVLDGFRIELVAQEPLVTDPVVGAFDEDGRLYVGELSDYPYQPHDRGRPIGTIRVLEDTDGDGTFDESHMFADELLWPTGLVPFKGGVFVAAAPDIWYLKDTDGDRRADIKQKLFTGFGTGNQQGMLNNLVLGLDRWIYGSSSVNGGRVRRADDSDSAEVEISGRAFRFDPVTLKFEATDGNAQFGNTFDDWGRRFTCSESTPFIQILYPAGYLGRNPRLVARALTRNIAADGTRVFRTSPLEPWRIIRSARRVASAWRDESDPSVNHHAITSAAGVTVYRGAAYPEAFRGNIFIGAAQTNLVHRRRLDGEGILQQAVRADDHTEFVRSSDIWFRPVNFVNAPDGTLYVLDLYREVIESVHIPLDVVEHLDLTRGRDRGRIYRIAPKGFDPPVAPRISTFATAELVAQLESPHGWWRDTASRLIYERQDAKAIAPLRRLAQESDSAQARRHALLALDGLKALLPADIARGLGDPSPYVRAAAVRLAESLLEQYDNLVVALAAITTDPSEVVLFQLALSLGESRDKRTRAATVELLRKNVANDPIRTAALSSLAGAETAAFAALMTDLEFRQTAAGASCLSQLVEMVGARRESEEIVAVLSELAAYDRFGGAAELRRELLLALAKALRRAGINLFSTKSASAEIRQMLAADLDWAYTVAPDRAAESHDRQLAYRLLSYGDYGRVRRAFRVGLEPDQPAELQKAVIEALANFSDVEIADLLITRWSQLEPSIAGDATRALLSRETWSAKLLDAIENGTLPSTAVPAERRPALLEHKNARIRATFKAVFGVTGPRADVIAAYDKALRLEGNPVRGEELFTKHCLTCHEYGGRGHAIGPNLAVTENHTAEALMSEILDPNRTINPNYMEYALIDARGRSTSGILAAQSSGSVTLRRAEGEETTIFRSDIEQMSNTGRSLMPEGFEKDITPQQMADLIAYILGIRYDRARSSTLPGLIEPEAATRETERHK